MLTVVQLHSAVVAGLLDARVAAGVDLVQALQRDRLAVVDRGARVPAHEVHRQEKVAGASASPTLGQQVVQLRVPLQEPRLSPPG